MPRFLGIQGALLLAVALALTANAGESRASPRAAISWRVPFFTVPKTAEVDVTLCADGTCYGIKGTPAKLAIVFKPQSGRFRPAQRRHLHELGVTSHFFVSQPVEISVRREGVRLLQIKANRVEVKYRQTQAPGTLQRAIQVSFNSKMQQRISTNFNAQI